ncbi:hypothetical protein FALBO_10178 [Fusarium albosuccineum]|uniref:Mating-type switching protein swi10 n=1 Tax=Fusarium albosuccineum TaxID=1237068 RepID=A0A8H4L4M6_9HYPO|nr:hypothetical protein FALBO_10178 [Fusarium albosuccineum]
MDSAPTTQTLKPPRRKLQKLDPKLKNKAKRGSADSTTSQSPDSAMLSPSYRSSHSGAPDLSDAKWSHYLRPQTVFSPSFSEPEPDLEPEYSPEPRAFFRPPRPRRSSQRQIPEFSHLTIQDPGTRPSLDNSSLPSPVSSTSTASAMRRQAKTPVFRIGQLEQHALARKGLDAPEKTSSVELIADQYRALLESRDSNGIVEEKPSQNSGATSPWMQDSLPVPHSAPLRLSRRSSQTKSQVPPPSPRPSRPYTPSVGTRDTNVVAFEGDTIYFKPYSFSPPPSPDETPGTSPQFHNDTFGAPPASARSCYENVSLQIALDLLTRELSSAIAGRPHRNGLDTAALQIWVMIEAYERLRDQVTRVESPNEETAKVGAMFDCWLDALYSMHSSLTNNALPSPREYAGLEEEVD